MSQSHAKKMNTHKAKFIARKTIAAHTSLYTFSKPEGFTFKAGQFVTMKVACDNDARRGVRSMSIACAPNEEMLAFAWRETGSGFKMFCNEMEPGDTIDLIGPSGHFTLPEDENVPIVFLIGGIGITPVMSILKEEEQKKSRREITLIYSNRTPETTAFQEDVKKIGLPNYKYVPTYTDVKEKNLSDNTEETGFITWEMVERHVQEPVKKHFYIVGTMEFIDAMRKMLNDNEVERSNITVDNFGKYS